MSGVNVMQPCNHRRDNCHTCPVPTKTHALRGRTRGYVNGEEADHETSEVGQHVCGICRYSEAVGHDTTCNTPTIKFATLHRATYNIINFRLQIRRFPGVIPYHEGKKLYIETCT